MSEHDAWRFTVIKAQGLRLLHAQKSWRAIVTVEVEESKHETILGVDGQNPNLKETFYLQKAIVESKVQISVWNRSESKKKSKKRNLLATASHTLGELFNRQEGPKSHLKVPLACQTVTKRAALSRGKRQDEVALYLRLRPPVDVNTHNERHEINEMLAEYETDISTEPESNDSPWKDDDTLLWSPPRRGKQIKKKPTRGYTIDSEDVPFSASEDGPDDENTPFFEDGWDGENDIVEDDSLGPTLGTEEAHVVLPAQQVAGILPQNTEEILVPTDFTFIGRALASFTVYRELSNAKSEADYEKLLGRLRTEWTYVGSVLVALSGINTTVFAISPDAVFTVDSYARRAIAASSIVSGLGLACISWILLRYSWTDLQTFKVRARDVLGLYFFFSLSARVPSICLFLSAIFLMAFLSLVAFDAWPEGVLVVSFLVGFFMTLQFLAYGVKWVFDGAVVCTSGIRQMWTWQKSDGT